VRSRILISALLLCAAPAWAAISEPAGCEAAANNCTPSNARVGDVLVGIGRRLGSATAPTNPTGWTSITTATVGSSTTEIAYRISCRIVGPGAQAAVTFTNAADVAIQIYRGANVSGSRSCGAIGTPVKNGTTSTTTYTYGGVTLTNDGGSSTSWVAGFGMLSATSSGGTNAPTGMTQQQVTSDSLLAAQDTNGAVSSWSSTNVTGGTSVNYATATFEVNAAPAVSACSSNCAGMVDTKPTGSNDTIDTPATNATTFHISLLNPSLSGNAVICGWTGKGTTTTLTVTTDKSQTFSNAVSGNDGTYMIGIRYLTGLTGGTSVTTWTFGAAVSDFTAHCTQYYNVSALDGTPPAVATGVAGNAFMAANSITPSQTGDLIYVFAAPTGGFCCNAWNWFLPGNGFHLKSVNNFLNAASESLSYGSTSAITPTIFTSNGSTNFNLAAAAFKTSSTGTAPSGIWLACQGVAYANATPYVMQNPCDFAGVNTQAMLSNTQDSDDKINSVKDAFGNSFTMVDPGTVYPIGAYENNAAADIPSSDANFETITFAATPGVEVLLYDVANADTSAFDGDVTNAGSQTAQGGSTCTNSSNSNSTITGTPTTNRKGIALFVEDNGDGPDGCGTPTTGATVDNWWYGGQDDGDSYGYTSSGYAHVPYTSNASLTYTNEWANTQGASSFNNLMMFLKAPASAAMQHRAFVIP